MSSTSSGPSLLRGGRGKKKPRVPPPPSGSSLLTGPEAFEAYTRSREATPSQPMVTTTAEGSFSPIFSPPAPPSLKRARSNTSSSLPPIPAEVMAGAPRNTSYFQHLFIKVAVDTGMEQFDPTPDSLIFCKTLEHIHRDYRKAIDGLTEDVSALNEQLEELRAARPQPATTTTAPEAPIPTPKAPEVSSGPAVPAPCPSVPQAPTAAPGPSWATVARRGRKKAHQQPKPSPTLASNPTQPKSAPPKKGITMRERRLVIKRDNSPLATTAVELRDSINKALSATYVQTISLEGGNVTITTMDSVKATTLNSKVSAFLHLIPATTTVHLDSPATQLLVHGIPTPHSLATIAM